MIPTASFRLSWRNKERALADAQGNMGFQNSFLRLEGLWTGLQTNIEGRFQAGGRHSSAFVWRQFSLGDLRL
jgi:hypothetical protein